ncbi:nucleotide exchange factor GrpE [Tepidiphilus margaritifer]|uniref:nucleotide exchange factor GrpE n=1 Tax=Tepidiphilus margaritifer TaxID=203471 RepID=UPI0003FA198B|nr:nucleotide exchange factor GrpE [Tepidiphilus margaritifer]
MTEETRRTEPIDQPQTPQAPSANESTANASEEKADVMPSLEEMLRIAEQKAAEHHDAWLRAKAEAENVRRRAQEEVAKASKFASERFAASMLPVKDSLEAALGTPNQTLETLRQGVELTLRQLENAFESANVRQIDPQGEKFDPHLHQAVGMIESDAEPNTVVQVLQKGYLLHERVLRPALVMVAKPKSEPASTEGGDGNASS